MAPWILLPWLAGALAATHRTPVQDAPTALVQAAMSSDRAYEGLVELSDDIGPRPAGSPALDRAIAWAQARMEADGLANVRAEPVQVPVWVRGEERATVTAPFTSQIKMLGIGNSVGTPPGGIDAEVVVVDSFEHLEALGEAVRDKIVLYDVPFTTYSATSAYRFKGAREASAQGAAAVLVRSIGPVGSRTPHAGTLNYKEADPIPAAAIAAEDAMKVRRWVERGLSVRMKLEMGAHFAEEAPSANVVGEVIGSEHPDEIVVLACHLDSWDVTPGAQDDAVGCATVMEAARLLAALPDPPARTLRVVLYTNEENGLSGARAYPVAHATEHHVAAIESDYGAGVPVGFGVDVWRPDEAADARATAAVLAHVAGVVPLLEPTGATRFEEGYGGDDVVFLTEQGVPTFGLDNEPDGYWPIHHTAADTPDKVDPEVVRRHVAAVAVLGWWLSENPPPMVEWPPDGPPEAQ